MRLSTVTFRNFRCFGPEPTKIELDSLTALVGANGSGKSAVLQGIARLFGTNPNDRIITKEDFHVPIGKTIDDVGKSMLSIEIRFDFPELIAANFSDDKRDSDDAIAACFGQMVVASEGERPYCRILLEASWSPSSSPEGDVDQFLYWLTTSDADFKDSDKIPVRAADRSRIQVHYVPASRDPDRHIRHISGSLLHHILSAVHWSEKVKTKVQESSESMNKEFASETGVSELHKSLQENWTKLHPNKQLGNVSVRPSNTRFEDLLKCVEAVFSPGPGGTEFSSNRLSDGLKSLFYLTVVGSAFDLLSPNSSFTSVKDDKPAVFNREKLDPPLLMIFAIEEPENHLAPHYLGRIISLLRRMSSAQHGQVILTSHSASILARVEPEEVRYVRIDLSNGKSSVRKLLLPKESSDAFKFVREAVRSFPELYFARLVVLGEGDSEEVVLPRIAESMGLQIDSSFVSIVPLAGRHVNHFWKLLSDLEIPFITLLDLDCGREGGGWGRIKYALKQLIRRGIAKKELLNVNNGEILSDDEFEEMHAWAFDEKLIKSWVDLLEKYDVFFSQPLDLDFMMLQKFESEYQGTGNRGPVIPKTEPNFAVAQSEVLVAVLSNTSPPAEMYKDSEKRLFFWYRYLFLTRSKPVSHLSALSRIKPQELAKKSPAVLKKLIKRIENLIAESVEE